MVVLGVCVFLMSEVPLYKVLSTTRISLTFHFAAAISLSLSPPLCNSYQCASELCLQELTIQTW